jgi:hypothetical protein
MDRTVEDNQTRLREIAYRIKYGGCENVSVRRPVIHHNQLKRFHDIRELETADVYTENTRKGENELATTETTDVVIVIDGPNVTPPSLRRLGSTLKITTTRKSNL